MKHLPPRPMPAPAPHLSLIHGRVAAMPRVRAGTAPAPDLISPLARSVETLVADAYAAGKQTGEVQHYMAGWRCGVVCGALAGLLVGGGLVALALTVGGA